MQKTSPYVLSNFASECSESYDRFMPQKLQEISSIASHKDTAVAVATKDSQEKFYSGDENKKKSLEVKFGDFIDYYNASFANTYHWLGSLENMQMYLCQCPIFVAQDINKKESANALQQCLSRLMQDINIPDILAQETLLQINLWMTVKPSKTNLHYDTYHNVLVVFYGRKRVTLFPPSDCERLCPSPIYGHSPNHSELSFCALEQLHSSRINRVVYEIKAGDALFIPEGWWHQVDSDEHTIGINYWFSGMREQLLENHQAHKYYSRVIMDELLKVECEVRMNYLRQQHTISSDCIIEDLAKKVAEAPVQAARENLMYGTSSNMLKPLQISLIHNYPSVWKKLVLDASPQFSAFIINEWETSEHYDAEAFSKIFFVWTSMNEEGAIQSNLLAKRSAYRKIILEELIRSIFGTQSDSPCQQREAMVTS